MQRYVPDHCPACGAPQQDDGKQHCHYCAAPRVPIGTPDPRHSRPCGGCGHHVSDHISFCPHCGGRMVSAPREGSELTCSACQDEAGPMDYLGVSPSVDHPEGYPVHGCRRCGGMWLDVRTFRALVEDARKQAIGDAKPTRRQMARRSATVVYRRCPTCQHQMHRKNFGRVSGIILDQCPKHGIFLDAGELPDVLAFVKSGGLALRDEVEKREKAWEDGQRKRIRQIDAQTHRSAGQSTGSAEAAALFAMSEPEPLSLIDAFTGWVARAIDRNW